jgi:hypothetical protein
MIEKKKHNSVTIIAMKLHIKQNINYTVENAKFNFL